MDTAIESQWYGADGKGGSSHALEWLQRYDSKVTATIESARDRHQLRSMSATSAAHRHE